MRSEFAASSLSVAVAALVSVGLGCLSLVELPAGAPGDLVLFFGRFHPVVLHLPFGLLLALVALEVAGRMNQAMDVEPACTLLLWMTAVAAVVAAVLGSLLALSGGYDDDTLFRHRWLGVGTALAVVWALVARGRVTYGVFLALAVAMLGVAGHNGGHLTHGSNYLVTYMPNGLRALFGIELREPPAEATEYVAEIEPILERFCVECHGEAKQEGDQRLDSYEAVMAAEVVTPGDPTGSKMIQVMRLDLFDLDHMPPDDQPQPSEEQIARIEAWIAAGATNE